MKYIFIFLILFSFLNCDEYEETSRQYNNTYTATCEICCCSQKVVLSEDQTRHPAITLYCKNCRRITPHRLK